MKKENSGFLILFLFFLSGFCNLVYEIVWARMFNLVFGVTVFAVSAVLASFMLGLAAGGFFYGRIPFLTKNHARAFSFLHAGIFVSTLALLLFFPVFQQIFLGIHKLFNPDFYLFRLILFSLSMVLMIVPTSLMGATFPAACGILVSRRENLGKDVGALYAVGTLGSVAGCMVTVFFLLGSAGMNGTIVIAAALDLLIGLAALSMKNRAPEGGNKS